MVNSQLYVSGANNVLVRHDQLEPYQKRFDPADDEEYEPRQHVEHADAFVIDSRKPSQLPVLSLRGRQKMRDCGGNRGVRIHFNVSM